MTDDNTPIAREGFFILFVSAALALAGFFLNIYLGIVLLGWFGFCVYFFRNPKRVTPASGMIAPADGKIIFIGKDRESHFLNREMQRITIFMSPFNVHVNRSPVTGTVLNTAVHAGKFLAAFDERASAENERVANHVRTTNGDEVVFVQIAGWFARRIISYLKAGDTVTTGKIFGVIKFGSRMDIYFPDSYPIHVKIGDMVKAGETVLALS